MKKILYFLAAAAAATVSCTQETQQPEIPSEGVINISIDYGGTTTRAETADTSPLEYETAIRKVDILVFNDKGQLNRYFPAGTALNDIKFSVSTGEKDIWTVINGPDLSSVVRSADIKALKTYLKDNIRSGEGQGFVMAGHVSRKVMPSPSENEITIDVHRFATRVALKKLAVNLPSAYESVTIKNVMLTNVVANQNLEGTAAPEEWYNKKGQTEGDDIIDGSTGREAECPDMTFKAVGTDVKNSGFLPLDTPWYFYGYPNPTAVDATEADGSFKEEQTRLVVTAEIEGKIYYYPVTLPTFNRNTAYEVELTIEGMGTDDPDELPQKGIIQASVTIQPWEAGAIVTETI